MASKPSFGSLPTSYAATWTRRNTSAPSSPLLPEYVCDSFEDEKHAQLTKEPGADPEDRDEYKAENVFSVPPAARWTYLQSSAKQPTIGKIVDEANGSMSSNRSRERDILFNYEVNLDRVTVEM